jgi:hypothetical protein
MDPIDVDRINILLEEYKTLRTEILSRTNNGYQLLAAGGALLAVVLANIKGLVASGQLWFTIGGGVLLLVIAVFLVIAMYSDISKAKVQVAALELRINKLAGECTLLTWETKGGGGIIPLGQRKQG